jgi:hypothetical protein
MNICQICGTREQVSPSVRFAFSGGLLLSVQDSASAEEVEQVTQPDPVPGSDTTSNLLSSGECIGANIAVYCWTLVFIYVSIKISQ